MSSGVSKPVRNREDDAALGPTVVALVAGFAVLAAVLFAPVRPPTVDQVENDIWSAWTARANDDLERTLADLIVEKNHDGGQRLLDTMGGLVQKNGNRFVVQTYLQYLAIRLPDGSTFAEWRAPSLDPSWSLDKPDDSGEGWKHREFPLVDPRNRQSLGRLFVSYRFYDGTLGYLPGIARLTDQYYTMVRLQVALAVVILLAVLANLYRIREKARRIHSQQVTLDLAHQLCHELRNGLWAFSLEGKNLDHFLQLVEEHLKASPEAMKQAAFAAQLDDRHADRLVRAVGRKLAEAGAEPGPEVLTQLTLAREGHRQIVGFARYLNLTVEELDRHLLGRSATWEPAPLPLVDAWQEACDLLAMRLRSTGGQIETSADPDAGDVFADRRDMVHTFVNLIKNALEAMQNQPPPRIITFTVANQKDGVVCKVRNDGPPIPAESLPHIFEPGFSTKRGAGRGRGLALAKSVIEASGGSMTVESVEGKGTTFVLKFPRPV